LSATIKAQYSRSRKQGYISNNQEKMGKESSEAGKFPSDPEFPEILANFATLKAPEAFPQGKYRGHFLKFYGNALLSAVATTLWHGADFRGSECICTTPKWTVWMMAEDKGKMSFVESVYDGKPCLRIDFKNRFYETRMRNDQEFLTIVTFKDASKRISDVNVLSPEV